MNIYVENSRSFADKCLELLNKKQAHATEFHFTSNKQKKKIEEKRSQKHQNLKVFGNHFHRALWK